MKGLIEMAEETITFFKNENEILRNQFEELRKEYDNFKLQTQLEKQLAETQKQIEISIFAVAVNISEITRSKDGFVYLEISFFGDC